MGCGSSTASTNVVSDLVEDKYSAPPLKRAAKEEEEEEAEGEAEEEEGGAGRGITCEDSEPSGTRANSDSEPRSSIDERSCDQRPSIVIQEAPRLGCEESQDSSKSAVIPDPRSDDSFAALSAVLGFCDAPARRMSQGPPSDHLHVNWNGRKRNHLGRGSGPSRRHTGFELGSLRKSDGVTLLDRVKRRVSLKVSTISPSGRSSLNSSSSRTSPVSGLHRQNRGRATFKDLSTYSCSFVVDYFMSRKKELIKPLSIKLDAAVLFVDMSGFSNLTEQFELQGGEGIEHLTNVLNEFMDKLLQCIFEHGGDVVKFAGDALIVMWPIDKNEESSVGNDSIPWSSSSRADRLRDVCTMACHCAIDLHQRYSGYKLCDSVELSIHSAIGSGSMYGCFVGGANDRWEFMLQGSTPHISRSSISSAGSRRSSASKRSSSLMDDAMENLWAASRQSQSGQIVLSQHVYENICGVMEVEEEELDYGCRILLTKSQTNPLSAVKTPSVMKRRSAFNTRILERLGIPVSVLNNLRTQIPRPVLSRLDEQQHKYLSELRTVSVLFVHLPTPNVSTQEGLQEFNLAVNCIQEESFEHGGLTRQVITDDKG